MLEPFLVPPFLIPLIRVWVRWHEMRTWAYLVLDKGSMEVFGRGRPVVDFRFPWFSFFA